MSRKAKMNNFILISITFSEVTEDSAKEGEFSRTGFIVKNKKVTFPELVGLMRDHNLPSSTGEIEETTWFSGNTYKYNFTKGIERQESIHFSRYNTSNASKYWKLARKFADR